MRIERVRLENFKPYPDIDLRLERGVTVIHGLNGSGKSSLLEACFFALYGSSALDGTLEDVITNGEEACEIELWFAHRESEFHIERRIRLSGERAQTATCVLETPEETIEGARDVEAAIEKLLRMDAEAFVNCAYVRQGEVNKLIHATPGERQDMIDDLLQLGKLEEYRERVSEARLGVNDVRADVRGSLREVESQIGEKEDEELPSLLNALETDLAELSGQIERFEENERNAERTRKEAAEVLAAHEETREEIADLEGECETLRETISGTEADREELSAELSATREQIADLERERDALLAETELDGAEPSAIEERRESLEDDLEERREELREASLAVQRAKSEAANADERAEGLEARAEEAREEAAALETEIEEGTDALEERRETLSTLEGEIAERRERFSDAPVDVGEADGWVAELREERESLRERETELRASLESARESVAEAERLREAGRCPECGQPVEESPHVDALSERRDRVADLESDLAETREEREAVEGRLERARSLAEAEDAIDRATERYESLEELLTDREASLEEKRERVGTLEARGEELASEADEQREVADEARERAEEAQQRVSELDEERSAVEARIDRLESLTERLDAIEDARERVATLRERREGLAELNDERRERLAEKRERKRDLEAEYDPERIERARENGREAEEYLEKVERKLAELRERERELRDRIGGVKNELDTLAELRERREGIEQRLAALDSLYAETEQLQGMYARLRAKLRQRNVEQLERMLNETFELVYQNDAYAKLELTGEYELTVYQKDGSPLDPEQLSGGERALFNLSLRCAIYRLLAEGIEGSAPMPPLILDEPTVFLDSGHVSKLVDLVESMRRLGVEQIVVVSHDDELVGAADDLVTVEKDPTTNRSTVERGEALLAAGVGGAGPAE
ncbi:MAG: DNA double-strand break repair ATPase Rad50 [Halalkalicoccus sp.]